MAKKIRTISLLMILSFMLIASCNKDETPVSASNNVPTSPQSLVITPGNLLATLTWQAPSNIGGSTITGYNIYRGLTSGGQTFIKTITGAVLSYNDSNLTNGTKYYYYVTALNNAGESNRSNEAFAIPIPNPTVPSEPLNAYALPGNNKVTLFWDIPYNNGGKPILGYKIYKGNDSTNLSLLVAVDTASARNYIDLSVINFNNYYYKITAFNIIGESNRTYSIKTTPSPYDQNSISGRVTFVDTIGYYKFRDTTKGYYNISAFGQWPPMGPASANVKLYPYMMNGKMVADYKLIVPGNGSYTITNSYNKLPYSAGSIYGLGKWGSDTSHVPAIVYDTTNARVHIINSIGNININYLSWIDTTKKIYRF